MTASIRTAAADDVPALVLRMANAQQHAGPDPSGFRSHAGFGTHGVILRIDIHDPRHEPADRVTATDEGVT